MRAVVVTGISIALLVGGCSSKARKQADEDHTGSAAGSGSELRGWNRIEALATPTVTPGPSKDLERAATLATTNADTWRDLRYKYPPAPITDYPHGVETVEALHAWASARGGLPALPKPSEVGEVLMPVHDVGRIAVASATDAKAAGLDDGTYLGTRLLTEGRSFLEVQVGLSLLGDVKRKLGQLTREAGGSAADFVAPDLDLVRVVAAEALHSRRTMDYATTPEGRKDFVDRAKSLEPDAKQLVEGVTGRTVGSLIPSDEEAAGLGQFWLAALEGAQRGEPAGTTIARVRKAAETAPEPARASAAAIARVLDMLAANAQQLREPSPY